jgi:hypothetical protein
MDLSTLTVAQLRDLQQQIPAELKRREQQEKQVLPSRNSSARMSRRPRRPAEK